MPRAWYNTDRTRSIATRLGAFFAVIAVFWVLSFFPVVARVFHSVQGGVYEGGALLGRAMSRLLAREDSLSAQLNMCTNRLESSVVIAAASEASLRETDEWRALVGYHARTSSKGVAARVIARDTPEESVVTIDRGENDGLRSGSAVVIGDGVLFGIIDRVFPTTATVRLIEDSSSAIPGAILGKQKTIGLVSGQEGALLAMDYIPQDTAIAANDIVVTSGLGGRIPQGIVIGTITDVIAMPSAPFIHVTITPVHDAREWTALMVLPYPEQTL